MRIEVYRGAGDAQGEDVNEPMLGSLAAMLERGRNELDEVAHQKTAVDVTAIPRTGVRLGQLVRVADSVNSGWIGKLTGIGIQYSNGVTTMRLNIERAEA